MRKLNKWRPLLLVVALMVWSLTTYASEATKSSINGNEEEKVDEIREFVVTDSDVEETRLSDKRIVEFGSYPKSKVYNAEVINVLNSKTADNDGNIEYNGDIYLKIEDGVYYVWESIQWYVIDTRGDESTLLSKNLIDGRSMGTGFYASSWEECPMRTWLNDVFYNTAFTDEEKKGIRAAELENDRGNSTTDKVWFLQYSDYSNNMYGFYENSDRVCESTDYANYKGDFYYFTRSTYTFGVSFWRGYISGTGALVSQLTGQESYGVRPVVCVNNSVLDRSTEEKVNTYVPSEKITEDMLYSTEYCTYLNNSTYNNMINTIIDDELNISDNPMWTDFNIAYRTVLSAGFLGQLKIIGNNIYYQTTGNDNTVNEVNAELALAYLNKLNENTGQAADMLEVLTSSIKKSSKVVGYMKKGCSKAADFKELSAAIVAETNAIEMGSYDSYVTDAEEIAEDIIKLYKQKELLKQLSNACKVSGKTLTSTQIIVSIVLLKMTNVETINYYMGLIPKDSGLYTGLRINRQKIEDGDIVTFIKEFIKEDTVDEVIGQVAEFALGESSTFLSISGKIDFGTKIIGYWMKKMGVLNLDEWLKATSSKTNQMTIKSALNNQYVKIINNVLGKESYDTNELKKGYQALYELYIACVLKTPDYLKNYAYDSALYKKLNDDVKKYKNKLTYAKYIKSCLANANASFTYIVKDGKATIKGGTTQTTYDTASTKSFTMLALNDTQEELTSIDIPSVVEEYEVTAIEEGVYTNDGGIMAITVPASVQVIGERAFEGCTNLEDIFFENGVTEIGNNAFAGCSNLTYANIPDTLTSIGEDAFAGAEKLTILCNSDSVGSSYAETNNITYNSKEKSVEKIEIQKEPDKMAYKMSEKIDLTGLQLRVYYVDGTDDVITEGYTGLFTKKEVGSGEITVCYGGVSAKFNCDIIADECEYIVYYVDGEGREIQTATKGTGMAGEDVIINAPVIEGYTPLQEKVTLSIGEYNALFLQYSETGKLKISDAKVSYKEKYTQTGKAITPDISVTYNGDALIKDKDYTIEYEDNINPGIGCIWITGIGEYEGLSLYTFEIEKCVSHIWVRWKTVKNATYLEAGSKTRTCTICGKKETASIGKLCGTTFKGLKNKKGKKASVSWKKNSKVTGYQIQYSTNSNFKGAKTKTVKGAKKTSYTLSKLKKGKTYYVRVRTYTKKNYSGWSNMKKVKIKK